MNFSLLEKKYLPTLDITLESYQHERTSAMHYHFASNKQENVFMVALRTMPHDSTGVAHILEHTALCGSKKFPIRDPFFSMLRRSMQTFMNAFTSSDWTAYPFATENKQDFYNLLQIYLDATFFPNLNYLDFLQEGHRFDFDDDGNLVIKGVVYNEMKGVYGNIYSRLYEMNSALLHGETTYHFDSGGDPQVIPHLQYEDFKAFHKKHYHPTNATFFTFGDIPAEEHHKNFEEFALKYFDEKGEKVDTPKETRFLSPIRTLRGYPSSDTSNTDQIHIILSWLLGPAHDAKTNLEFSILYNYLLQHSGSPLYHALENAEFTKTVSPFTMLDDSGAELALSTGIVTNDTKYTDEVEKLVFDTLKKVVSDGVDPEIIDGIIDQIDTSLRKQNISEPYGLTLILQVIGAATHGENLANIADPAHILDEIREKAKDPKYLANILENEIIKNPHFVRLTAFPDENSVQEELNLEKKYCKNALEKMSNDEKQKIRDNIIALEKHQENSGDMNILPKIHIGDIPRTNKITQGRNEISKSHIHYNSPTNGVLYTKKFFPLALNSLDEIAHFSFLTSLIGELGYDNLSYTEALKEISKKGNINGSLSLIRPYKTENICPLFQVSTRFLGKNENEAISTFEKFIQTAKFEEIEQIRNIFDEKLLTATTNLTTNGHKTAMQRANSGSTLQAKILENTNGIGGYLTMKNFVKKNNDEIVKTFQESYEKIKNSSPLILTIGSSEINIAPKDDNFELTTSTISDFTPTIIREAWIADLGVNYCALSLKTVAPEHNDAPLLTLLGKFLWNGYLHSAIREQGGAYGSGASHDRASHNFQFFSYCDPRIEGTFADFEQSIKWFLENSHEEERLEEAKIGIIAQIDTPQMPAIEASTDALYHLQNYSEEARNRERQIVLDATIEDLKRVAETYLTDFSNANKVVITGTQNAEIVKKMGLSIHELN